MAQFFDRSSYPLADVMVLSRPGGGYFFTLFIALFASMALPFAAASSLAAGVVRSSAPPGWRQWPVFCLPPCIGKS